MKLFRHAKFQPGNKTCAGMTEKCCDFCVYSSYYTPRDELLGDEPPDLSAPYDDCLARCPSNVVHQLTNAGFTSEKVPSITGPIPAGPHGPEPQFPITDGPVLTCFITEASASQESVSRPLVHVLPASPRPIRVLSTSYIRILYYPHLIHVLPASFSRIHLRPIRILSTSYQLPIHTLST